MILSRATRRRRKDQFLRQIQRLRLRAIARGEIEPASDRELGWRVNLKCGARFSEDDFIIPGILFSAERMLIELEAQEAAAEAAGPEVEAPTPAHPRDPKGGA